MPALDSDEYMEMNNPQMRPAISGIMIKYFVPLLLAATLFALWKMLPVFTNLFSADGVYAKNGGAYIVYARYFYIPFLILIIIYMAYTAINNTIEKLYITNKAVLMRKLFETRKIYFTEITSMTVEKVYDRARTNHRNWDSWLIALIFNINYRLIINSAGKYISIDHIAKSKALWLKAELQQKRTVT